MKSIVIMILIIALFGCKEQKEIKDLSTFESIEYSYLCWLLSEYQDFKQWRYVLFPTVLIIIILVPNSIL